MTKSVPKDLASSVRQRLLNKARESRRPFNELLQHFGMERFLYRLSKSRHAGRFILKGALMFNMWKGPASRPTMDIDLLGYLDNRVDEILAAMRDVCLQQVESDGFSFDPESLEGEKIIENAYYEGVRVRLRGSLGTARVTIQVDVAFGDVIVPGPVLGSYPAMLDLPSPSIKGYSRESVIAEKFEVTVKLGILNSRLKDFFDIWSLANRFDFDGETVAKAIVETFRNRRTGMHPQLTELTNALAQDESKKSQWQGFIRRNRLENVPERLRDVMTSIATFLGPIAESVAAGSRFSGTWRRHPGPWIKTESHDAESPTQDPRPKFPRPE